MSVHLIVIFPPVTYTYIYTYSFMIFSKFFFCCATLWRWRFILLIEPDLHDNSGNCYLYCYKKSVPRSFTSLMSKDCYPFVYSIRGTNRIKWRTSFKSTVPPPSYFGPCLTSEKLNFAISILSPSLSSVLQILSGLPYDLSSIEVFHSRCLWTFPCDSEANPRLATCTHFFNGFGPVNINS